MLRPFGERVIRAVNARALNGICEDVKRGLAANADDFNAKRGKVELLISEYHRAVGKYFGERRFRFLVHPRDITHAAR